MFASKFRSRIAIGLCLLGGSIAWGQEDVPTTGPTAEAAEDKSPRLLAKTDQVFVHYAPWQQPGEARWDWTPYGELYLTQRDDGTMARLLSSGVEGLPTRRMKYVERRIAAVGFANDRLVAVVWNTTSWDRPPSQQRPGAVADEPLSRFQSFHLFSLADGKEVGRRGLSAAEHEQLQDFDDLPLTDVPQTLSEELAAKCAALLEEKPRPPAQ